MTVDLAALNIASSVIDGLAMVLTLFRLWLRIRIRRFWWEDAWAGVVLVCGMTYIIVHLICYENVNDETTLITSWLVTYLVTSSLWAVRMSLLCSIIRVVPPSSTFRKITDAIAVLFLLCWAALIALKIWWCTTNTKFLPLLGSMRPQCHLPELIISSELITDCVSDATLVVLSLKLLWKVKLPRRQRRMIIYVFLSTAVMSMFSVLHAICQLVADEAVESVAFDLEMSSALIVCNLLVVVTYMYRVILRSPNGSLPSESESSSEDDDFTTRMLGNRSPQSLTTVDLDDLDTAYATTDRGFTSGAVPSSFHSSAVVSG